MSKHAEFSPSGMHRLVECPGSWQLQKKFPNKTSVWSKEGDLAHLIIHEILKRKDKGKDFASLINDIKSEEMRDVVVEYIDWLEGYETAFLASRKFEYRGTEEKLILNKDIWGTCDRILIGSKGDEWHALLVDFKYGAGVLVEATDNPQTKTYGLCANKTFMDKITKFYLVIYQPRARGADKPYSIFKTDAKALKSWRKQIDKAIDKAKNAPYFKAGDHCKFCRAEGRCQTQIEHTKKITQTEVALTFPKFKLAPAGTYDLERAVIIHQNRKFIEDWLAANDHHIIQEMSSGTKIPGFKLVTKKGPRTIIKDEKFVEQELKAIGVKNPYRKKFKTITQLDKECKQLGFEEMPDHLTERSSKAQIAPVDDPRPELGTLELGAVDLSLIPDDD